MEGSSEYHETVESELRAIRVVLTSLCLWLEAINTSIREAAGLAEDNYSRKVQVIHHGTSDHHSS